MITDGRKFQDSKPVAGSLELTMLAAGAKIKA